MCVRLHGIGSYNIPPLVFVQISEIDQWLCHIGMLALLPDIYTFLELLLCQIALSHVPVQQAQIIYHPGNEHVLLPLQPIYKNFQCSGVSSEYQAMCGSRERTYLLKKPSAWPWSFFVR